MAEKKRKPATRNKRNDANVEGLVSLYGTDGKGQGRAKKPPKRGKSV